MKTKFGLSAASESKAFNAKTQSKQRAQRTAFNNFFFFAFFAILCAFALRRETAAARRIADSLADLGPEKTVRAFIVVRSGGDFGQRFCRRLYDARKLPAMREPFNARPLVGPCSSRVPPRP